MATLRDRLDHLWYPQGEGWDIAALRAEVLRALRPDAVLLDVGAGRGAQPALDFRGHAAEIWGADIDPIVAENPLIDRAFVTQPDGLTGVPDASVDVCLCCDVLEHVTQPEAFFAEIRRILRPGGVFIAKTPNRLHYVAVLARATPYWFHKVYNRWRGRAEVDTFPTVYRANRPRRIRELAGKAGLIVERLWLMEGRPEYLRMTPLTYLFGFIYERLVNALRLDSLKVVIFMRLKRGDQRLPS